MSASGPSGPLVDRFFFIFAGTKETYNISDGTEIQQDPTRDL